MSERSGQPLVHFHMAVGKGKNRRTLPNTPPGTSGNVIAAMGFIDGQKPVVDAAGIFVTKDKRAGGQKGQVMSVSLHILDAREDHH